jgi:hypothetical protein
MKNGKERRFVERSFRLGGQASHPSLGGGMDERSREWIAEHAF